MITIVSRPVFLCPHRRLSPTNQTTSFETQMIPMTPQVLRRTLKASQRFAGRSVRSTLPYHGKRPTIHVCDIIVADDMFAL
jgi:hypothetical protein